MARVKQRQRHGLTASERLWSYIAVGEPTECWPFLSCRTAAGYGHIYVNGRFQYAHRLVLAEQLGHEPNIACHRCDNPPCCNPAHLYDGTPADNNRDRSERGPAWPRKLTAEQQAEVLTATGESYRSLGQRFGVHHSTISRLLKGGGPHRKN